MGIQAWATVSRYTEHNRIREQIDPGFVRCRLARLPQPPFYCVEIGPKFVFNLPTAWIAFGHACFSVCDTEERCGEETSGVLCTLQFHRINPFPRDNCVAGDTESTVFLWKADMKQWDLRNCANLGTQCSLQLVLNISVCDSEWGP